MRKIKLFPIVFLVFLYFTNVVYPYGFWDPEGTGNYRRWEAGDIPVSYKISTWWLPSATEPVGAVYAAFKTWEDVTSASISFNYQGTTNDTFPPMELIYDEGLGGYLYVPEEDGVNMIGWIADVGGDEDYWGVLGIACISRYDTETNYFEEFDIMLNIRWPWTTTSEANKYDLQGIVTHEVGHILGLRHTDWWIENGYMSQSAWIAAYPELCECTMISGPTFYSMHTTGDEAMLRTLEEDDIAGISVLYPPGYGSGGGGAGGGCFVVTAAYGTPFAKEVKILSRFRDELLLKNRPGELFVKTYYKVSPRIAKSIKNTPWLRRIVRLHLKPVVFIANLVVSDDIN